MKELKLFVMMLFVASLFMCSSGQVYQQKPCSWCEPGKASYKKGKGLEIVHVSDPVETSELGDAIDDVKAGLDGLVAKWMSTEAMKRYIKEKEKDKVEKKVIREKVERYIKTETDQKIHGVESNETFTERLPDGKIRLWMKGLWSEMSMKAAFRALQEEKIQDLPLEKQIAKKAVMEQMRMVLGE